MKSRKNPPSGQKNLFMMRLENLVDDRHELVILAGKVDWKKFEEKFGASFSDDMGRPALPTRLMVGLQYLKYLHNESDENVVQRFLENPYWQFFCGNEFFEHRLPCHPTSLNKWRQRLGSGGAEQMLKETIEMAKRDNLLTEEQTSEVYVDTTVQPKSISYPTDGALVDTARRMLVRIAEKDGILLKQSYRHVGRKTLLGHIMAKHRKDYKQAKKRLRKLRTYLGRVIRDVERKAKSMSQQLAHGLRIAKAILSQRASSKNKIYSVHAPEVRCIAKGKIHKKYEFGNKVSVATTVKGNWIVGLLSFSGNPYDGHTIPDVLNQIKRMIGAYPNAAYCDRGYKGSEGIVYNTNVTLQGTKRGISSKLKQKLLSRSAIEPVIGHLKSDHRMDRNFLLGETGDRINAAMAACGFNLRKLIRAFLFWLFAMLQHRPHRMAVHLTA
jgi:IS5 family transposase